MVGKYSFEHPFKTILSTQKEQRTEMHGTTLLNMLVWFTDGSKTNEGIGARVAGPFTNYYESIGMFPSIIQVEVHAIG